MIVSHRHRFVFVKTRKTAGTSLEVFLSGVCGDEDIVTPILPHVEPHRARNYDGFFNHMPAAAIRDRVGRGVWDGYFTFCVERNPWDKTLSYYHMQRVRGGGSLTFDDYLRSEDFPVDFPAYTENGRLVVDRVLRYERLAADLTDVFANLGVPFPGTLNVRAKAEYRTDRRPYREVYTSAQAEVVRRAFAAEIAHFEYDF